MTQMSPMPEQELKDLLILTYLGEWMSNAQRVNPIKSFQRAASKIYALAQGTSLASWVEFDPKDDRWSPTMLLEESAQRMTWEYDDESMWEELTDRLAERDAEKEFGRKAFESLRGMDRFGAIEPHERRYQKEFETNGLEYLRVTKPMPIAQSISSGPKTELGMAWYHEDDWAKLLEISEDRAELEKEHVDWLTNALKRQEELEVRGIYMRRLWIDLDALKSWCDLNDKKVTMESRAQYAAHLLEKSDSKRTEPVDVKAGRNDLCPCGSGKKYKKCCLD